jgi:hypothetical protein
MVYERVTGAASEASVHARPDKQWLGMLLCALSAVLTLTLGAIIANSILSIGDATVVADDAPVLEGFQAAAGRRGHH